jgi:hypothetical protein
MLKRCRVVFDTERGPLECELELPQQATVAAALEAARARLADLPVDWESAPTGIFGESCARERVPVDGDRIEVYRMLLADPRQSRRNRVARKPGRRGQR